MLLAKTSMFLALGSFLIAGVPTAIAKDRKGQSSRLGYAYAPEGNQTNSKRSEAIRECSTNANQLSGLSDHAANRIQVLYVRSRSVV